MNLPYPNSAWKMTLQTLHIFLHVPSDGAPLCPIFMFAREWVPLDWECLWWCFAPAPPPPLFNTNLVIKHGKWKIHHLARGFPINCDIHLVWTFSGQPRLITGGFFFVDSRTSSANQSWQWGNGKSTYRLVLSHQDHHF